MSKDRTETRADLRDVAALQLKKAIRLVKTIRVSLDEKTGRVMPELSPVEAWRLLPAFIRSTCDLAAALGIETEDIATIRATGELIDAGRVPQTGGAK